MKRSGHTGQFLMFMLLICTALLVPLNSLAAPAEKVTIQLKWQHQFQFAGYYAALEKGFYAEQGLDVELRERSNSSPYIDEVVAGKAQYGVADTSLLLARMQGQPVVLLAQIFQHSPVVLITRKDSDIRRPYELAGKRIMYDSKGQGDAPLTAMLLDSLGSLGKVTTTEHSFRHEDLIEGKVDAIEGDLTTQPYWFDQRGVAINIIDPRDYGIDFYGDNLFTTEQEIRQHPQRVKKLLEATLKGWRYALEHQGEIIDLILDKYNSQQLSRDFLEYEAQETTKMIAPGFIKLGSFASSRFQKIAEAYARLGFKSQDNIDDEFFFNTGSVSLQLSDAEQQWLAKHKKIRFGADPSWPPYDYVDNSGNHQGLIAEILHQINARLDVPLERVPNLSWPQVLQGLHERSLDMASLCARTPQRDKYLSYSTPVTTSHWVIVTQTGHPPVRKLEDLINKRVGVSSGYAVAEQIRREHSSITIQESPGPEAGLRAVATGVTDAYVGYLGSVAHLIKKRGLSNLKIASGTNFDAVPLHICVRSDAPELLSIINKGLQQISSPEMDAIINRWLPLQIDDIAKENIEFDLAIVIASMSLLIFSAVVMLMYIASRRDDLATRFGSSGFRRGLIIGQAVFVVLLILLAWTILEYNRRQLADAKQVEIETMLGTTAERLHVWKNTQQLLLEQIARNQKLVAITEELLTVPVRLDDLKNSAALARAREFDRVFLQSFGDLGFFIINPERSNIGSMRDSNLGQTNLIQQQKPDLLNRAFQGETVFIPPIDSDVVLDDKPQDNSAIIPTMFFAAPIRNHRGEVIAVLTKRMDPQQSFSQVLLSGRFGQTGETYAFDRAGQMLSESRFTQQLIEIGLLQPKQGSILNLQLRDPGGNLLSGHRAMRPRTTRPLTQMAASAIQGNSGNNMSGYRDYRGVEVVGTWLWDDDLNIGLTSEVDKEEIFAPYVVMQWTVFGVLGLVLIIAVSGTTFTLLVGEKASHALRRTRDELEARVSDRTEALEKEVLARKRAARELRQFKNTLDQTLDCVFMFDADRLQFFYANEGALQQVGYTREELHHMHPYDIKPYFTETELRKVITPLRDSRQTTLTFETVHQHKNGELIPVEIFLQYMQPENQPPHYVAIVRNITERRQLQEKLTQQKKLLDMLHRSTTSFVEKGDFGKAMNDMLDTLLELTDSAYGFTGEVLLDEQGKPYLQTHAITNIAWNKETEEMFEQFKQKGLEFHNLDTLFGHVMTSRDVVISNQPDSDPRAGGMPSGHPEMTGFLGAPIFYGEELVGMYGIANRPGGYDENVLNLLRPFDTTYGVLIHSKRMAELEQSNRIELVEAKESAERANRAKSEFLSSMSHELRTPLNAILGFSQLFEYETGLSDEQKDNAREIYNAGSHLLSLINDVLDLAKIEAGHMQLSIEQVSVKSVLNECRVLVTPVANAHQIELSDLPAECDHVLVEADFTRLKQVLLNLLSNAIKYNREHGSVSIQCNPNRNGYARISIVDTGVGIAQDKQHELFQPFNRLGAQFSSTEGTGIGLVITKQLVELMHGRIGLSSIANEGSTFWVELKLSATTTTDAPLTIDATPESVAANEQNDDQQARILIAEDNPANQMVMQQQMQLLGYQATLVEDGEQAWQLWQTGQYDLLLTDIQMPNMNGYELVARIRSEKQQGGAHKPVIAITANAMAEDAQRCLDSGMDDYIAKPVNLDDLRRVLEKWFVTGGEPASDDDRSSNE
ncbi:MAG: ABC transporter substrate-binding protein [Chromatiales bacterium]|jgi:PAS domain S-box-containing protein